METVGGRIQLMLLSNSHILPDLPGLGLISPSRSLACLESLTFNSIYSRLDPGQI